MAAAASLFSLSLSLCSIGLKATSVTSAEGGLTWRDKGRGAKEDWIGISFLP